MTPETERRTEQAGIRRYILIQAMGGKCCYCPCVEVERLEFHHTGPREWKTRDKSRWSRQAIYEREWIEGKIELACAYCNKRLGAPDDPEDKPF